MAFQVQTQFVGEEQLKRNLEALADRAQVQFAGALYMEGEAIMAESKERYVPVDLGTLRNSGHTQLPKIVGRETSVTLGYGGPAAAYALAIHEHPSAHSPRSWRGKSPSQIHWNVSGSGVKYLELPMLAAAKDLCKRIALRVKLAL